MSATELEFEDSTPPAPPRREHRAPEQEYRPDIPADAFGPEPDPEPPRPLRQPQFAPGRVLPHSIDAEEAVLALCMLDGAEIIGQCLRSRVGPESCYEPKHEIIFGCLVDLYHRNAKIIDSSIVAEELKSRKQLDQVGGYAFLAQISSKIPTTAQATYFIEKVKSYAVQREIIRQATAVVEETYNFTSDLDALMHNVTSRMARVVESGRKDLALKARAITSFEYPTKEDPNILIGSDDYLGRGGGMLFVSHAGAGKSSFIMDAVMSWGIGEPWVGIKCNGPLKSLVIQAEDSDRYVGKVAVSFAQVRKLTPAQRAQLRENCVVVQVRGITGDAFFAEVERLVEIHRPDLVVVNPIYLYAEGDISKSECAQPFLVGLDRVNREMRFGWILVHHTGKPKDKDGKGKRAELDDWETIYMGFGSSYLANWPRCSALLEPRPKERGRYWLKLGKAGSNAGVTKRVPVQGGMSFRLEPTTRVALRHSTELINVDGIDRPAIYWELDEEEANEGGESQSAPSDDRSDARRGRKPQFTFNEFRIAIRNAACGVDKRQGYNVLYRAACNVKGIGKGSFNRVLDEGLSEGFLLKHDDGRYYMD